MEPTKHDGNKNSIILLRCLQLGLQGSSKQVRYLKSYPPVPKRIFMP